MTGTLRLPYFLTFRVENNGHQTIHCHGNKAKHASVHVEQSETTRDFAANSSEDPPVDTGKLG